MRDHSLMSYSKVHMECHDGLFHQFLELEQSLNLGAVDVDLRRRLNDEIAVAAREVFWPIKDTLRRTTFELAMEDRG